ncbi:hypothetical protein M3Y98_00656000 [Aphelenchoides besseyi]|nr:hypothetical protein M3Y98_00656000 [Aphelenchoides besseyi]
MVQISFCDMIVFLLSSRSQHLQSLVGSLSRLRTQRLLLTIHTITQGMYNNFWTPMTDSVMDVFVVACSMVFALIFCAGNKQKQNGTPSEVVGGNKTPGAAVPGKVKSKGGKSQVVYFPGADPDATKTTATQVNTAVQNTGAQGVQSMVNQSQAGNNDEGYENINPNQRPLAAVPPQT